VELAKLMGKDKNVVRADLNITCKGHLRYARRF